MWEKISKNISKIVLAVGLVGMLALLRIFEDELFYDPFLQYFRGEFINEPLPVSDNFKLVLSFALRFGLNTAISLAIIQLVFRDRKLSGFAATLYGFFFIVLTGLFFSLLLLWDEPHKMYLFYIRRFLIQPVLLLLFIPAFYFQKLQSNR